IEVWDASTGKRLSEATAQHQLDSDRLGATMSPDGRTVALWVPADWSVAPILGSPSGDVAARLGSKSALDHKVLLVDAQTGESRKVLEGHSNLINGCAFNPQSTRLVSVGADGKAILWNAHSGGMIRSLQETGEQIHAAAFAPDGQTVATAGTDLAISLWNVETGTLLRKLGGHTSHVKFIAFAPDGESLAAADLNNVIRISSLRTSPVRTLRDDANATDLAWMKDDGSVIYADVSGTLRRQSVNAADRSGQALGNALTVIVSDDGQLIAAIDKDGRLMLGHARETIELEPVAGIPELSNDCAASLAFSHDGTQLACIEAENRQAFILDVATRRSAVHLPPSDAKLTSVAWRDDGQLLAIGSEGKQIALYRPRSGKVVEKLATQFPVRNIAFRPQSSQLAAIGSVDRFVEIWDTSTGNSRLVIPGYQSQADDLVYTPDGKRLITAGPRKSVTIWDADSGDELLVLDDAHELPFHLAINSNNRMLAAAVGLPPHGKIVTWDGSAESSPARPQ
ncbi:MAG: WD40 repeat domain-containing protein, partial [Planctomycetaceae bacterium]|nr:WD40 repeat domain-containing protein [Planctomycetaceae bacterium]